MLENSTYSVIYDNLQSVPEDDNSKIILRAISPILMMIARIFDQDNADHFTPDSMASAIIDKLERMRLQHDDNIYTDLMTLLLPFDDTMKIKPSFAEKLAKMMPLLIRLCNLSKIAPAEKNKLIQNAAAAAAALAPVPLPATADVPLPAAAAVPLPAAAAAVPLPAADALFPFQRSPLPSDPLVMFDLLSSRCLYHYDTFGNWIQVNVVNTYALDSLSCLTPSGLIPVSNLNTHEDYINKNGLFSLNPVNVKQIGFRLTNQSPKDKDKAVSIHGVRHPFNQFNETVPFGLYTRDPNMNINALYQTDVIRVSMSIKSQLNTTDLFTIHIDPHAMTNDFARDLQNVHFYDDSKNLGTRQEQMVYARLTFEELTEPICARLEYLLIKHPIPPQLPDNPSEELVLESMSATHMRVPYIYKFNMHDMTCHRSRMRGHDISAIPIMNLEEYRSLDVEQYIIKYMIFQIIFTHRAITIDQLMSQEDYMMVFDFYLRRTPESIGFHYDVSTNFEVSSFSLLYCMPLDSIKVGPHMIAIPIETIPRAGLDESYATTSDGRGAVRQVAGVFPAITPIVKRNSILIANNKVAAHTSPTVDEFLRRDDKSIRLRYADLSAKSRLGTESANVDIRFPVLEIPEAIRDDVNRSTRDTTRTFFRGWHLVTLSPAQAQLQDPWEQIYDNFRGLVEHTLSEFLVWYRSAGCVCININHPTPLLAPGHLGGNANHSVNRNIVNKNIVKKMSLPSRSLKYIKPMQVPKPTTIRASTISNAREYIRTKMNKIKTIYEDPNKNMIVTCSSRESGSSRKSRQSGSSRKSRKSGSSRKSRKSGSSRKSRSSR
jgi:hypothetical protein